MELDLSGLSDRKSPAGIFGDKGKALAALAGIWITFFGLLLVFMLQRREPSQERRTARMQMPPRLPAAPEAQSSLRDESRNGAELRDSLHALKPGLNSRTLAPDPSSIRRRDGSPLFDTVLDSGQADSLGARPLDLKAEGFVDGTLPGETQAGQHASGSGAAEDNELATGYGPAGEADAASAANAAGAAGAANVSVSADDAADRSAVAGTGIRVVQLAQRGTGSTNRTQNVIRAGPARQAGGHADGAGGAYEVRGAGYGAFGAQDTSGSSSDARPYSAALRIAPGGAGLDGAGSGGAANPEKSPSGGGSLHGGGGGGGGAGRGGLLVESSKADEDKDGGDKKDEPGKNEDSGGKKGRIIIPTSNPFQPYVIVDACPKGTEPEVSDWPQDGDMTCVKDKRRPADDDTPDKDEAGGDEDGRGTASAGYLLKRAHEHARAAGALKGGALRKLVALESRRLPEVSHDAQRAAQLVKKTAMLARKGRAQFSGVPKAAEAFADLHELLTDSKHNGGELIRPSLIDSLVIAGKEIDSGLDMVRDLRLECGQANSKTSGPGVAGQEKILTGLGRTLSTRRALAWALGRIDERINPVISDLGSRQKLRQALLLKTYRKQIHEDLSKAISLLPHEPTGETKRHDAGDPIASDALKTQRQIAVLVARTAEEFDTYPATSDRDWLTRHLEGAQEHAHVATRMLDNRPAYPLQSVVLSARTFSHAHHYVCLSVKDLTKMADQARRDKTRVGSSR